MVVVDESEAHDFRTSRGFPGQPRVRLDGNSGWLRHILEGTVLFIVEKENAVAETHGKVSEAVVVIITRCTGYRRSVLIQACLLGHIFEFAVSKVVVERHRALSSVIRQKQIDVSVIVVVQETCTRTSERCAVFRWPN